MTLLILAFVGGALTILSPCILPVLPFVFARTGQPFARSTLPLLGGMALTFAGVATLAAVGGAWAVRVNQYGRVLALLVLLVFAATLLSRSFATWLASPLVRAGNRLSAPAGGSGTVGSSILLGVATGLLWAPCAGPILGLVLTGAALSGPSAHTSLLLLAYAAGAAASLALAILGGGRVVQALKGTLGAGEWLRRGLGVAIVLGVAMIAAGVDTGLLTRLSYASTSNIEQSLIGTLRPQSNPASGPMSMVMSADQGASAGPHTEGNLPPFTGASLWLNSPPLTPEALRGKVVLVDFWTYSCINCLRSLPYVKAWYQRYRDHGLVVIGVHAPEFAFEKNADNVRAAVTRLGVAYPVVLDNDYAIWQSFNNQYWPAHYFIDAAGHIRGHHFGEGDYAESEQTLRALLLEAGARDLPPAGTAGMAATGVEAAADEAHIQSPETYIGYGRAEHFSSPGGVAPDTARTYAAPATLNLNDWALGGHWTVRQDRAVLDQATGAIVFRFQARDLHLVMGPGEQGRPIHFRVLLDGQAPAASHGSDVDEQGRGVVTSERLYQLIRQTAPVGVHTLTIQFEEPGLQAYSFTFG